MYLPKVYQIQPTDPRTDYRRNNTSSSAMLLRSSHLSPTSTSLAPRPVPSTLPPRPAISQNRTMPEPDEGEYIPESIQRTGSGSFFRFSKRKNKEEQQKLSQIRAQELSDLYELNPNKETNLNKNANIKKSLSLSPTLVMSMTPEQAKQVFEAKQKQRKEPKVDPLLKPHELKSKQRLEEMTRRKKEIKDRQALEEVIGAPIGQRRIQSQPPAGHERQPLLDQDCLLPKSRSLPQNDDDNYWTTATESVEVVAQPVGISFVTPTLPSDLQAKLFAAKKSSFSDNSYDKMRSFDSGYDSVSKKDGGKSMQRVRNNKVHEAHIMC